MNTILQFMKRNYKVIIAVVLLAVGLWSFIPKQKESNPEKDKLLLELLTYVLERGHYHPLAIDDNLSKKIYKEYIEGLDPSKRFFLQSDINDFKKYETAIDDQIKNKDLTFFDLTYSRLLLRMEESKNYANEILDKPFDYTVKEEINTDYEKLPYAKNVAELKERWRKQLKLSALATLVDKQKMQDEEQKNAGKPLEERLKEYREKMGKKSTPELEKKFVDDISKAKTEKPKSFVELEEYSRENTQKSLDEFYSFVKDYDRNDWFGVYINAIVTQYDPHTQYFPPIEKEKFDASISGKYDGIGARLQKKNDITEITELILGGPAWRGKELEAGDKILKVAQGNKEPVDVVGMRIDDVVKKIKGPKGTEVRLTVKKTDGTIKIISIIRDEVEMEETYAKSSIVEKDGYKYGIIYLPKFYIDFENKDSRDAAKDIAIEVEKLKKEQVKGIVMDVRDNGGGSLKTVVDIAGLFIPEGPIVQVKSAAGKKEVLYDKDKAVQWDGPLVIMINEFSASASEILAAAMQDYKRAIVIGSKKSYGKGTVQQVIDLNQFLRGSDVGDLGALKTTTQKFYRINGGSTQREGVKSDVPMPDKYAYLKMSEDDVENALPWDKIDVANYTTWNKPFNYDLAITNSKFRIEKNQQLKLIDENAKWLDEQSKNHTISLNIDQYKAHQKLLEETGKKYKAITKYNNNLEFKTLQADEIQVNKDVAIKEKRQSWYDDLSKDVYIEEAVHILNDMNGFKKAITQRQN